MRSALLELAQRVGQRVLVGQVDAGGRLVEEEQLGLAGEGAGDQHPLLLPAGEVGDAVAGPVGQTDHRECLGDGGRSARPSGRSSRRRVSRPEATTSQTEAGTPDVAPARCGTKPIRRQSWN